VTSKNLLTIGVPTFNRAHILENFLKCLQIDLNSFEDKVKIIISDNNSTDNTFQVFHDWLSYSNSKLNIKYIKNKSNIGFSANLIQLYYIADTEYFMFLGDDDRINIDEFSKIVSILESKQPSAIIQCEWPSRNFLHKDKYLEFEELATIFYEFGNAWASIVDRAAAVNAIESRRLRNEIEKIVWPQTVIGYLLMFDLRNIKRPYAFSGPIGFPIMSGRQIIDTGAYWIRSLNDLLLAASIIDYWTAKNNLKNSFLRLRSLGFIDHFKAILLCSLIESKPLNFKPLKATLKNYYGFYGLIWTLIFEVLRYKKFLKTLMKIYFFLFKSYSFAKVDHRLDQYKKKRIFEISAIKESKKRNSDWF